VYTRRESQARLVKTRAFYIIHVPNINSLFHHPQAPDQEEPRWSTTLRLFRSSFILIDSRDDHVSSQSIIRTCIILIVYIPLWRWCKSHSKVLFRHILSFVQFLR